MQDRYTKWERAYASRANLPRGFETKASLGGLTSGGCAAPRVTRWSPEPATRGDVLRSRFGRRCGAEADCSGVSGRSQGRAGLGDARLWNTILADYTTSTRAACRHVAAVRVQSATGFRGERLRSRHLLELFFILN